MRDDPTVVDLVRRAGDGDSSAWNALVERYAPLVWSICRRFGLSADDTDDVGQNVWLILIEHLSSMRDPAALPGWLVTTTRRECLRVLRVKQDRERALTAAQRDLVLAADATPVDDWLLTEERHLALRAAFTQLPPSCQSLLTLLLHDPPLSYAEIGARLGTKVGGLGPRRARCLDRLRNCPAMVAFLGSSATSTDTNGTERRRKYDQPLVER